MLEPSFLSNITKLTCEDPDFERFKLRTRGLDATLRIMTVHSVDLLYCTPGIGYQKLYIPHSGGLREFLLAELQSSRFAGHLGV